ncbi:MAG: hypothetical protein ACI8RD_004904 [Bacillariaceae sp.]|jgi:hypothetical protein
MMSQFLPIIVIVVILAMTTKITTTNAEGIYGQFDNGAIGDIGGSSWFDSSRWTNMLKVPSSADMVWIDESNTYVAIDSTQEIAEVKELVIGRSGESNSMESVQVDLLEGATLNVATNIIIGQYLESDGTLYASYGSEIKIGETLTIGSEGGGLVILKGNAQITANDINICGADSAGGSGCRLIMDDESTLNLNGNKKDKLNEMIQNGLIVSSSKEIKKSFEVMESNGSTTVKIIGVSQIDLPVQTSYVREYPFNG